MTPLGRAQPDWCLGSRRSSALLYEYGPRTDTGATETHLLNSKWLRGTQISSALLMRGETSATAHLAQQNKFYGMHLTRWDHMRNKGMVVLPAMNFGDFKDVTGNSAPIAASPKMSNSTAPQFLPPPVCGLSSWQRGATSSIATSSQGNTGACQTASSFLLLGFS